MITERKGGEDDGGGWREERKGGWTSGTPLNVFFLGFVSPCFTSIIIYHLYKHIHLDVFRFVGLENFLVWSILGSISRCSETTSWPGPPGRRRLHRPRSEESCKRSSQSSQGSPGVAIYFSFLFSLWVNPLLGRFFFLFYRLLKQVLSPSLVN